jgi:hypothetical protein
MHNCGVHSSDTPFKLDNEAYLNDAIDSLRDEIARQAKHD